MAPHKRSCREHRLTEGGTGPPTASSTSAEGGKGASRQRPLAGGSTGHMGGGRAGSMACPWALTPAAQLCNASTISLVALLDTCEAADLANFKVFSNVRSFKKLMGAFFLLLCAASSAFPSVTVKMSWGTRSYGFNWEHCTTESSLLFKRVSASAPVSSKPSGESNIRDGREKKGLNLQS